LSIDDEETIKPIKMEPPTPRTKQNSKRTRKEKVKIPAKFIDHIITLGFSPGDAARLYENKADWLGAHTGGSIRCTEKGCRHQQPIGGECLSRHAREVHNWKDYPCPYDNCSYVAFSKISFSKHQSFFHSDSLSYTHQDYRCSRRGCHASFKFRSGLAKHESVHANHVFHCGFCPYRNACTKALSFHERVHFNVRNYACDVCARKFFSKGELNLHFSQFHEESHTTCPVCGVYTSYRNNVNRHLISVHKIRGSKWDANAKLFAIPNGAK